MYTELLSTEELKLMNWEWIHDLEIENNNIELSPILNDLLSELSGKYDLEVSILEKLVSFFLQNKSLVARISYCQHLLNTISNNTFFFQCIKSYS